jgi:hypothetical protein
MHYLKYKYVTLFVLSFLTILFLNSCDKEDLQDTKPSIQNQETAELQWQNLNLNISAQSAEAEKGGKCDYSSIQVIRGMLSFIDMDHFRKTLTCLENELESHNLSFDQAYSSTPTEQLDNIADNIGFDDWKPLVEFEQLFNYSSRRAYIENQVVTWLNNTNIVWQNDPDELDGLSEELRTLLNIDGKVYIGGQIYNYIPSDESVEITVNNLQVASSLMAPDSCYRFRRKVEFFPYGTSPSKKFKLKTIAYSYPWKVKQKVKLVNFKQRSNGTWRRSRTEISVNVQGFVRDADCNFPLQTGATNGPRRRHSLKAKRVNWLLPTWAKYKTNEVAGFGTVEAGAVAGYVAL